MSGFFWGSDEFRIQILKIIHKKFNKITFIFNVYLKKKNKLKVSIYKKKFNKKYNFYV